MANKKTINTVSERTWNRNGEIDHTQDDGERCYRCNRPVVDGDSALFLSVCDGGFTARRPGSDRGDESANLGLQPIGPTCAKQYRGFAFTAADWAKLDK